VAVLAGYPGTIASTWQRVGRAGRRQGTSAAVLVASSAPLDQFMVQNPDYFFGRSPEHGYVNPDNLFILLNHLKCAAFELPLREEEKFGSLDLRRLCQHLEEVGSCITPQTAGIGFRRVTPPTRSACAPSPRTTS